MVVNGLAEDVRERGAWEQAVLAALRRGAASGVQIRISPAMDDRHVELQFMIGGELSHAVLFPVEMAAGPVVDELARLMPRRRRAA